ncbi:BrnA antitoxin family protein [Phenylobacterium aquaticum]|uniref:BrnA antitoxin family protein n=1 Tax=Phenylobacterium aquaticum TaxID=1763816 RepID=UPI0026ECFB75|nr:BrnA antitoxin family protein [Phenylobacterium aquaticum]
MSSTKEIEDRLAAMPEPDLDDPDNPEWTEEMFARAWTVETAPPEFRELFRKPLGRPKAERPKVAVKLRLDQDVVEHFKAGGPGWQTRINAALALLVAKPG